MPGGKVHVVSDNQQYKAFTIDLAKPPADLAIVGRVVWAGRDL
jgi:phage repressor protein C with HTH and peptisase S24 domain